MKAKVAVLISGTGTNMAALLYASRQPGSAYEIVLVASNRAEAAGLALAEAEGIATFARPHKGMERADHDALMEQAVLDAGADYIVLAGYMRILSPEFTERWHGRMLNIHPSLLPKYRGLETHKRAIEAGDPVAGASVHLVSSELDAGEVLGQTEVAIRADDTAETLAERVKLAEHQLYPRVVNEYVGRIFDGEWLLGQLRDLALQLPEAEERPSHGAPGWCTGGKSGKYFAHFSDRHHGNEHIALLAKTSGIDEMMALIGRDPQTFFKPAYYGASGWVGIILNRPDCDWDQVGHWLKRSWQSVAPKRLTKLLDAADEF
ncbi:phosphoribosylglycinamide formyltransferase [Pontixanthobacter aquaemixtae]|uniref:Phosphoribosylglycinamide formyltransferase n=1 Tax=Pontixanthobacter aquaemixtae TaxID=1958940 RepID=A0A844ZUY7_9SPHN|nr:phosphoribosylglycinamide formyltransferase [Pontixanthobacter aquaemixtae]MXO90766.1 phosphoribosylglycinamide formyltransferase [Pontixanthobacter aquaemixtae]